MSKRSIKNELARIDRMKIADIDYSDIPRLDKTFFKKRQWLGLRRKSN
ncbi:MAG: hypothetical protein WBW12_07940 [Terriglobales bacterium]